MGKTRSLGKVFGSVLRSYDKNISDLKSLRLELAPDELFLLAAISLLASGLELIWEIGRSRRAQLKTKVRPGS